MQKQNVLKFCKSALVITMSVSLLAGCGTVEADEATQVKGSPRRNSANNTNYTVDYSALDTSDYKYHEYQDMSVEEIVASLTLEQKAAQMVQPAIYETSEDAMELYDYGSVLSKTEPVKYKEWASIVNGLQNAALKSDAGIPFIYGQDDVHGVNYCTGAVIYPHNIGIGASHDPDLLYEIGLATADEAKLCHMLWNFAPCVAQSNDPRWGRTYESYGSDLDDIKTMSAAYTQGLIDGGMVACAKHFFADGNVEFGTGEVSDCDRLIDRGEATLTDAEIDELLDVYQNLIDTGVQTIMISHSSLNGVKMHENGKYIQYLKNEMGFEGFIVSDWKSVDNTSGETYEEQLINCVNAGIDMFMEIDTCDEAIEIIVNGVESGDISEERVNDAVTRIIKVKKEEGLFDDPFGLELETVQSETGSDEYRALAEKMVEESLVLLKNEDDILPLNDDAVIYITGPAANNSAVQCGGWTLDWNSAPTDYVSGATTILDGFKHVGEEKGIEVITDVNNAAAADVVIAVLGEESYAEWYGDTEDMDLCGSLGLYGNEDTLAEIKELGKPTVLLIVAGRQVLISDYIDDFDAVVMCYLPGTEGQGIANVICGDADFTGTLPSPWYENVDQIGTNNCMFKRGYGLKYE